MELRPGFTAIVGPNGTGKSNLTDAVRWALSTGRPSDGRLGHRDDVLFAGAPGRRAASMCEVRLTFDNQDRRLPIDAEEVEIMRRLYRGGESEYRLQGAHCRARDIERLLAELGLAEGYAWIGQGRVEEVVDQDPAQRRRLLEDAAGASTYRERRREAILELARADQEAEVQRALESEISEHLPELRRLRDQAEAAQELRASIQRLEIGLARRRIDRLQQSLARAVERRRQAEENRGRGGAVLEREAEVEQAVMALQGGLSELLSRLERQIASVEGRAQAAAGEEAAAAERERSSLQRHGEMHQRLQDLEQARRRLQAELADASLRLAAAEATLRAAGDRGAEALRALARLPQLEEALRQSAGQLEQAQENLRLLRERLERARAGAEDVLSAEQAQTQALEAAAAELRAAREEERLRSAERDRVERQAAELSELRRAAERALPPAVRAVLAASREGRLEGVLGTLGELARPREDRVRLALATALGGQAADLVMQGEAAARQAIAWLRDSRAGRATFLPLGALEAGAPARATEHPGCLGPLLDFAEYPQEVSDAVRFRLGRTLLATDIAAAQAVAAATGRRLRVVTLDGQLVQVGGALTGGQALNLLPQAPSPAAIAQAEQELQDADAAWRRAHVRLGQAMERDRQERAKAESTLGAAERVRRELAELGRDAAAGEELVHHGEGARARLLGEIADCRAAAPQDGTQGLQEASLQQALLQEETLRLTRAVARAEEDETRQRAQLAAAAEALRQASSEAGRRKQVREACLAWRDLLSGQRQRLQHLQRLLLVLERLAERAAREVAARTAGAQQEVQQLGEEIERLAQELQQQQRGLLEAHGRESLEAPAPALPAGAEEKLQQARRDLQEIGGVDADAGRRHQEEEQRLLEIQEKLRDIGGAKAALIEVLALADQEVESRYRGAIRTVGEAFSRIAQRLFGEHTQARLVPVADGVDIEIRLPGKDGVRMSWLSGGERALTAIAFLFALSELRVPPFYLLDEVEAALDERNVERFAVFLRSQRGRQLIVVTHQRPTMEAGEQVIGTTMQLQGVTRLASVLLGEVMDSGPMGQMA